MWILEDRIDQVCNRSRGRKASVAQVYASRSFIPFGDKEAKARYEQEVMDRRAATLGRASAVRNGGQAIRTNFVFCGTIACKK